MANLEFFIYQIQVDGTVTLITRLSCQPQESYELIRNITYLSQQEEESMEMGAGKALSFLDVDLKTKTELVCWRLCLPY